MTESGDDNSPHNQTWYGPDAATFGARITAAREQTGMTQRELARRLGVRLATLRAWENDTAEPQANKLSMMAGLLNVSITWLINGEGAGMDGPPANATELSDSWRDILTEMHNLRIDLLAKAERVTQMEKRFRRLAKEYSHD